MNDIIKAAAMGAAAVFGMYAAGAVCAVVTNVVIKKDDSKQTEEAPKQEQEQAPAVG